jgi:tetratricopeptide (TPR) repeat protein
MLYRFWPDRDRLPFMDIHQAGTPEIRFLYMRAFYRPIGWAELDGRYRFDWALVDRAQRGASRILDFIDADSSFALVFLDDVAAVYVRRSGPLRDLAARLAYRTLPAAPAARKAVLQASLADSALRRRVTGELEREAAGSPWSAAASSALADLALFAGRVDDARTALTRVLAVAPRAQGTHQRLGILALAEGRPRDALDQFSRERAVSGESPAVMIGIANARRRLGQPEAARAAYRRALELDPGNPFARDSLATLSPDVR